MRQILFLILSTLLGLSASAQIFIPGDPIGSKAVYKTTDSQGKSSRETHTLEKVVGNRVWVTFDGDKDSSIPSMHYSRDAFTLSMKELDQWVKSMMPSEVDKLAKIQISGDFGDKFRFLPLKGRTGQTLKDQAMTVKVDAGMLLGFHMKLRLSLVDDQILRTEMHDTPLGKHELLVRKYVMRSDTDVKILGKHEKESDSELVTQWIIPGRGVYKEESRDSKGKLTKTKVLISFTKAK